MLAIERSNVTFVVGIVLCFEELFDEEVVDTVDVTLMITPGVSVSIIVDRITFDSLSNCQSGSI